MDGLLLCIGAMSERQGESRRGDGGGGDGGGGGMEEGEMEEEGWRVMQVTMAHNETQSTLIVLEMNAPSLLSIAQ